MGTKNNPGEFDCYANADPNEPIFVVLGRDPAGGALVRLWAEVRLVLKPADPKITEAVECADSMDAWCRHVGRNPSGSLLGIIPTSLLEEELRRRSEATIGAIPATDSRWRHVKRGSDYTVVGLGTVQSKIPLFDSVGVVVYRGIDDGRIFVRPPSEFSDGRFAPLF